jgi:HK97 family phage major capsid protein
MEKLIERLKAIVAKAEEIRTEVDTLLELDELTDEQTARFGTLEKEAEALTVERAQIESKIETRKAIVELAEAPANVENGDGARGGVIRTTDDPYDLTGIRTFGVSPREVGRELRGRALKAIEVDRFLDDTQKQRATTLLERVDNRDGVLAKHMLVTGSEDYREAWAKLMTQVSPVLTEAEARAVEAARAMSLSGSAGGYAIPFTLDPTIILTSDGAINPLRQIAKVVEIVTDQWNGVSSAGVTAAYAAEAAEVADGAPTLAQPTMDVEKAHAFVPYSIEAGMDIANLAQSVAEMFQDAKDTLEATKFVLGVGSGSDEPTGVVTAVAAVSGSRVAATTNDSFGLPDLYKLVNALPPRHRPNASFLGEGAIYNLIRQFDTSGGAALWETLREGRPNQLLGKPAFEASAMDGALGTGDDDILLYGDFRKFQIVDRIGLAVEFIPHLFDTANNLPSGQRGWYAFWRNGAGVLDANAFRILRV